MKYCSHCGNVADDEALYCTKCGCTIDGKNRKCENEEYNGNNNHNENNCDSNQNSQYTVNMSDKSTNILLLLLSFFFPIVGLVLYIAYQNTDKEKANSAGKGALIGVCVSVGLSILSTIFGLLFSTALGSFFYSLLG